MLRSLWEARAAAAAPPKAVGESLPKPGCRMEGARQSEPDREKAASSRWRACELPQASYSLEEAPRGQGAGVWVTAPWVCPRRPPVTQMEAGG